MSDRNDETRRCPECGRGVLVGVSFREASSGAREEDIQEADTRQLETYSCGHESLGPRLDQTGTPAGADLQVEQRSSEETVEPL